MMLFRTILLGCLAAQAGAFLASPTSPPLLRVKTRGDGTCSYGGKMLKLRMGADESEEVKALIPKLQKNSVFIVGMDGAPKAQVSQTLAKGLGYKFMDTNEVIEQLLQAPIDQAFKAMPEEDFVKVERAVLDQAQAYYGSVVSTGSAAPLDSENWAKFRTGLVVYLKVESDKLEETGFQSPMKSEAAALLDLQDKDRLELLLAQRTSFYEQADITVPLDNPKDIDASVLQVAKGLAQFILDNPAPENPKLSEAHAQAISRIMEIENPDEPEQEPAKNQDPKQIDALNALLKDQGDEK